MTGQAESNVFTLLPAGPLQAHVAASASKIYCGLILPLRLVIERVCGAHDIGQSSSRLK